MSSPYPPQFGKWLSVHGIAFVWSSQRNAFRCVSVWTDISYANYGTVHREIVDIPPNIEAIKSFLGY